ncbi:hypothetical protein ND16A_0030 [Thalassotalea sp. ND16A]|nr:hypothetical protein ND16A_0030 [Thalassotalea sp. ND16A]
MKFERDSYSIFYKFPAVIVSLIITQRAMLKEFYAALYIFSVK